MTATQMVHAIAGAPPHDDCTDHDVSACWVCGGASTRGMDRVRWMGSNYTSQNRAMMPASQLVCEACVTVMAGRPPNTERMWSHLVEGADHVRLNKGSKPVMREFIRRAHNAAWFAAIADTGQKHIVPWCVVNAANQRGGVVLFEETLVELPRDDAGWSLIDAIADILTAGATKEEITTGNYGSRAWQLCGARLRIFERDRRYMRGGTWFDLALWLAQRDEVSVAMRMENEKAARVANKAKEVSRGRTTSRKNANPDRRSDSGAEVCIPRDARLQRDASLGSDPGPDACSSTVVREPGGVAHDHDAHPATRSGETGQLSLLS